MPELKIGRYRNMPIVQESQSLNFAIQDSKVDAIKASDLEKLLEKGVEVYGNEDPRYYTTDYNPSKTHCALLIGYKPIENQEPVSKSELLKALKAESDKDYLIGSTEINELISRIEKNGVRND